MQDLQQDQQQNEKRCVGNEEPQRRRAPICLQYKKGRCIRVNANEWYETRSLDV